MIRGCLYGTVAQSELDEADLTIQDWIQPAAAVAAISAEVGVELSAERIDVICTDAEGVWSVWLQVDLPDPQPCPHGDPACPCQDGDTCHYVATEDTPAMTPPGKDLAQEQ